MITASEQSQFILECKMRADRLISLLMLLQQPGKITGRELAKRLEVSERTIYRDISVLSTSGVPVYGEPGPNGGYTLLDGYRTQLTGLNERETRALFMLNIPSPLVDLGISQDLQRAFLKLISSLPEEQRRSESDVRQRIHIDSSWWETYNAPIPYLQTIENAIWSDTRLRISYRPLHVIEIDHVVDPYGLVAKAGIWYLVFELRDRMRVQPVSEFRQVVLTDQVFNRKQEFVLADFWRSWCDEQQFYWRNYPVTIRVAEHFIQELPAHFGYKIRDEIKKAGPPDSQGRITIEISFQTPQAAREKLLSYGSAVEVIKPEALRTTIADYAQQIVNLYTWENSQGIRSSL